MKKRAALIWTILFAALLLCGCKQNPSEEKLFAKLIGHFEQRGYVCELARLDDSEPDRDVPIYKASVWHKLTLNGAEEILVYFDESNRADYLSAPIDESVYGHTGRFGLRFVLVYPGEDSGILTAMKEMPQ